MLNNKLKMERVLLLIDQLIDCLMIKLKEENLDCKTENTDKSGYTALILLNIIFKNVEGVLLLAKCDCNLLPPALVISRTLLETSAKLTWLIKPEDKMSREQNLLTFMKDDKGQLKKFIESLEFEKNDLAEKEKNVNHERLKQMLISSLKDAENDKKIICQECQEFETNLRNQSLNISQQKMSMPSTLQLLKKMGEHQELFKQVNQISLYFTYNRLCLSVHGNYSETLIYKSKQFITPTDWHTPLYIGYFTLLHSSLTFLKTYSTNFDEGLLVKKGKEIEKALTLLISV